jgi:putative MATE family efflux protein
MLATGLARWRAAWVDARDIRRALARLALPIVGANLLQRGVGIVDAALVGRLGAEPLAAVGLANLLMLFVLSLVFGLGLGSTVLVAFHTGAGDGARRARAVRATFLLGAAASALLIPAGLAGSRLAARLLGASGPVEDLAVEYLAVLWAGFGFRVYLQLGTAVFQGAGDTRTPLKMLVWVNLLHVGLAVPLVFGWGGLPKLGVVGAAVGTVASEALGAVGLWVAARRRALLSLAGPWADRGEIARIFRVGMPTVGERLITQGMQLVYARLVITFGVAAYAAHQVGLSIEALSFLPGLAFAQGATALVGQRLGAGDPRGARQAGVQACLVALAVMTGFGISYWAFPARWVSLFTTDPLVLAYGHTLMTVMAALQPPLGLAMALSGALRGAGDTRLVMYSAIIGGWGLRLPVAYVVGLAAGGGIWVVWLTMIMDWAARAALTLWRFRYLRWDAVRL